MRHFHLPTFLWLLWQKPITFPQGGALEAVAENVTEGLESSKTVNRQHHYLRGLLEEASKKRATIITRTTKHSTLNPYEARQTGSRIINSEGYKFIFGDINLSHQFVN